MENQYRVIEGKIEDVCECGSRKIEKLKVIATRENQSWKFTIFFGKNADRIRQCK